MTRDDKRKEVVDEEKFECPSMFWNEDNMKLVRYCLNLDRRLSVSDTHIVETVEMSKSTIHCIYLEGLERLKRRIVGARSLIKSTWKLYYKNALDHIFHCGRLPGPGQHGNGGPFCSFTVQTWLRLTFFCFLK